MFNSVQDRVHSSWAFIAVVNLALQHLKRTRSSARRRIAEITGRHIARGFILAEALDVGTGLF